MGRHKKVNKESEMFNPLREEGAENMTSKEVALPAPVIETPDTDPEPAVEVQDVAPAKATVAPADLPIKEEAPRVQQTFGTVSVKRVQIMKLPCLRCRRDTEGELFCGDCGTKRNQ